MDHRPGRIASLDAFRGLAIAGMILVNNPGSWAHVYPPLLHAPWHGWTPTDLVFPFFLFIVGVAIPLAFGSRRERGSSDGELLAHATRRALVLVGLGLFMAAVPRFDWATLRIPGVLQRIGVVYLASALAWLWLGRSARVALTVLILTGYQAVMTLWPVPGGVAGDLSPEGNLAAWVDRALLDGHLWSQTRTWDPEGILSTVPAVGTCLMGTLCGESLRGRRATAALSRALLLWGMAGVGVGWMWGRWFPINKNLWTSSYVVFTAGIALVVLAALHHRMDVQGRGRALHPLVVYGRNALAVFVASGLLAKTFILTRIPDGEGVSVSLYTWLYERMYLPWLDPIDASLAFAVSAVLLWGAVSWGLDRHRIYIKV